MNKLASSIALVLLGLPLVGCGTTLSDRVLVIYNSNSAESEEVADYYLNRRAIPAVNKFGYAFHDTKHNGVSNQTLYYADPTKGYLPFQAALRDYLQNTQAADGQTLKDKILYIVFTYQTPFVVNNSPYNFHGRGGVCLDSFVSDLWDEAPLFQEGKDGTVKKNPYDATARSEYGSGVRVETQPPTPFQSFADFRDRGDNRIAGFPHNGPAAHIYCVWRLDAPTAAQAKAQVDGALFAEANGLQGTFFFNTYGSPESKRHSYPPGVWQACSDMVLRAAKIAQQNPRIGPRVVTEYLALNDPPHPSAKNAACYFNWGDGYKDVFTWEKGAFGACFRSAPLAGGPRAGLAASLKDTAQLWSVGAIDRGISVTSGNISEPYTYAIHAFDVVMRALLEGANQGDAWARSHQILAWNDMNVGDPLYTPFGPGVPSASSSPADADVKDRK